MARTTRSAGLLLVLMLLPATLFAFGKNKIVYDEFDWTIYHSTHFDVYFYEEEKDSLQKVVNFAESAYDDLSRKFNFQIPKKVPLIFYATHSAFEQTNTLLMFIPEGVGAFAEPVKNRMVLPIDMPDEGLLELIKHELTHIFEYEILYQGQLQKSIRANPPTWLMEGLASFMAEDEDSIDRMVLRDAVVNDSLPSVSQNFGGFFAYRFGHAVFRYMREKYGWEGVRDFVYEYRNTLGNSVEKPLKRAFDLTIEEFDTRFRTWLRKQYLPALISKGEPTEYGEPFRVEVGLKSQELSPAISPSGDLLAAFTTYKNDIDVAIFNVPERKMMRNLTRGYPDRYEYIIAQFLTAGPVMGRDIGFSPTGDQIAVFAKKERGRNLLLINALSGGLDRSVPMEVEQQLNPSYSPDGKKIVFHGFEGNRADLFIYDIESNRVSNLTNDAFFDAAPVWSPDGKWIVYSSVVKGFAKLFRLEVANPSRRFQLTQGEWNDVDATFSPDGKRIFYASDRLTGREQITASENLQKAEEEAKPPGSVTPPVDPIEFATYNIYSIDTASGEVLQYTDVVGGCFAPNVFIGAGNKERLIFSSYYKARWGMYSTTTDKNLGTAETIPIPSDPILPEQREAFVSPVEVAIDPEKVDDYGGFKLFVENVEVNAGVNSDQTFISRSVIYMSDMLGDRRFVASLDSVSTFSNFDFLYFDLRKRMNWGVRLFDDRSFFVARDFETGDIDRRRLDRTTGLIGLVSYPFDRYHRVDVGTGYVIRDIDYPTGVFRGDELVRVFIPRQDEFPIVTSSFSGDSAIFTSVGPISGRRYNVSASYSADLNEGGTLSNDYVLDFRQYLQVTERTLLAARVFGGYSDGNFPNIYYFGGLNTLRGYDFRTFVGTRAFFANFEFRFPLIDLLATPYFNLTQIRGSLFFDVGGAFFGDEDFEFSDKDHLVDGKAAVGYGIAVNLFGLELHWDFARRTDLQEVENTYKTTFWIGETF